MAVDRVVGYNSYLQNLSTFNASSRVADLQSAPIRPQEQQPAIQQQKPEQQVIREDQVDLRQQAPRKDAPLEDIQISLGASAKDPSLSSYSQELDQNMARKAVSAMQKDSILQEYQYFVGSAQNAGGMQQAGTVMFSDTEGSVIAK